MNIIIPQPNPQILTQRTHNLPILPRYSWRRHRCSRDLRPTLEVDVCGGFFRVRCAREDDVGVLGAEVAVMALVDYEGGGGNGFGWDFVCVEEVEEFGGCGGYVLAGGDEAYVVGCGTGCDLTINQGKMGGVTLCRML